MATTHKHGAGLVVVIGGKGSQPDSGGAPPLYTREQRQRHAADLEAAFTGRPQPHGSYDPELDGGRVSASTAGYMELDGAQKSGDCDLVEVAEGVAGEKGCCNLFTPQPAAGEFECAQCVHFQSGSADSEAAMNDR
jgi:hypothetical protein